MGKFNDARIKAIIAGTTQFRVVPFPVLGSDEEIDIAVRCLSESELDGCRIEAQRSLREISKRRGWDAKDTADVDPDLLQRLIERSIITRAFYDPDTVPPHGSTPETFFASERELEQLGSVQTTLLMQIYVEHQEFVNPHRSLSEDQAKELIDRLGKAQDAQVFLSAYAPRTLVSLCLSLASRLREISPIGK